VLKWNTTELAYVNKKTVRLCLSTWLLSAKHGGWNRIFVLHINHPRNLCLRLYLKFIHHYNLMRWTVIWGFPISKLPSIDKYSITTNHLDACQLENWKAIKVKQDPHCTLQKPAIPISTTAYAISYAIKLSTLLVSPSVVWLVKGKGAGGGHNWYFHSA